MQLTTERLIIRELKLTDLERFDRFANSEFVLRYLCMYKMTREESLEYIKKMIEKGQDYAVALRDSDELIGKIHLDDDPMHYDVNSVDLGYWIGEPYARQGYMTEALHAVIDYLFHVKAYDMVTASVLAPNTASAALLRRLGFMQEGYLRRTIRYNGVIYDGMPFSMLKEEFGKSDS